jgi:hypothetical protein
MICCLGSGSLLNLELSSRRAVSAAYARILAGQTALKHLVLEGYPLCDIPFIAIGAVRIDLLQSLNFSSMDSLDAPLLDALRKAASVTALFIGMCELGSHKGLTQAVAELTQLRSLSLAFVLDGHTVDTPRDLTTLTALTRLYLGGDLLDKEDLQALLILKNLRELDLCFCGLTNDDVPELRVLTNLDSLKLSDWTGSLDLAPVTNVLDPLREARGWPPMRASCQGIWDLLSAPGGW